MRFNTHIFTVRSISAPYSPHPFSLTTAFFSPNSNPSFFTFSLLRWASISSLKVQWRKDTKLDQAILNDRKWRLCARVVREVLNEPGHTIPLRYLEKRRERLRLKVKAKTFLDQNPNLFETYLDRIRPKSELVPFVRPSERLRRFMEDERRIFEKNEPFLVSKLCKLLMMSMEKRICPDKLLHVKREFGFPNDFLTNLVPRYPKYFKFVVDGDGKNKLELVSWEPEFAKSVILNRAEEEERLTGIRVRPSFNWELPPGFLIKKEMREWVRDWMEMPYISPYDCALHLDKATREMEKRRVGVFHEVLSLSLYKRIPVPILGKFWEEYALTNEIAKMLTRHSGIFYVSLKGGIQTGILREAYKGDVLIDRDPLLEIKDKFVDMLEEGWKERKEQLNLQKLSNEKDAELMAVTDGELQHQECQQHFEDEMS